MRRLKKISLWTAGISAFMLVLYLLTLAILPRFIDAEVVKREIHHQFSQMVGGRINFEWLELKMWPTPHIEIRQVRIAIPPPLTLIKQM
jgi:uncharacterized protein involved in outer membrane biogenesis